jgi:hypothetical protein
MEKLAARLRRNRLTELRLQCPAQKPELAALLGPVIEFTMVRSSPAFPLNGMRACSLVPVRRRRRIREEDVA